MADATNQPINPPGEEQSLPGKALKAAAQAVQNFQAINPCQHVCGFHMAAHDSTRQVRPTLANPCAQHPRPCAQCAQAFRKGHTWFGVRSSFQSIMPHRQFESASLM